MSGLSRLQNMFRVADLRNKILFTFFIIFLFRMGSHIPVPYVDSSGTLPHDKLMRSIELYGTKVMPLVRDMLN